MSPKTKCKFSIVRYGNVFGSRGSIVPYLLNNNSNIVKLTDKKMTRFVISIEDGINFVFNCLKNMSGGEIFVPKLPSIEIRKLIYAMTDSEDFKLIGIRPGEKLHEVMIPKEESLNCIEMKDYYIIQPMLSWWDRKKIKKNIKQYGKKVLKPFEYSSENNKVFFLLTLLCFLVPFSISNRSQILINFFPFPYSLEIPIYLLILVLFFIAFILGYVFSRILK